MIVKYEHMTDRDRPHDYMLSRASGTDIPIKHRCDGSATTVWRGARRFKCDHCQQLFADSELGHDGSWYVLPVHPLPDAAQEKMISEISTCVLLTELRRRDEI